MFLKKHYKLKTFLTSKNLNIVYEKHFKLQTKLIQRFLNKKVDSHSHE